MSGPAGSPDELDQALALANGLPAGSASGGACANCPARGGPAGGSTDRTRAEAEPDAGASGDRDRGGDDGGDRDGGGAADDPAEPWLSATSASTEGLRSAVVPGAADVDGGSRAGATPPEADEDLAAPWLSASSASTEGLRSAAPSDGPAVDDDLAPAWLLGSADRDRDRDPDTPAEGGRFSEVMRALRRPAGDTAREASPADDGLLPEWLTRAARRVGRSRPEAPDPAGASDPADALAAPWVPPVPTRPADDARTRPAPAEDTETAPARVPVPPSEPAVDAARAGAAAGGVEPAGADGAYSPSPATPFGEPAVGGADARGPGLDPPHVAGLRRTDGGPAEGARPRSLDGPASAPSAAPDEAGSVTGPVPPGSAWRPEAGDPAAGGAAPARPEPRPSPESFAPGRCPQPQGCGAGLEEHSGPAERVSGRALDDVAVGRGPAGPDTVCAEGAGPAPTGEPVAGEGLGPSEQWAGCRSSVSGEPGPGAGAAGPGPVWGSGGGACGGAGGSGAGEGSGSSERWAGCRSAVAGESPSGVAGRGPVWGSGSGPRGEPVAGEGSGPSVARVGADPHGEAACGHLREGDVRAGRTGAGAVESGTAAPVASDGAPAFGGPGRGGAPGERDDGRVTSHRAAAGAATGDPADVSEAPPPAGRTGRPEARGAEPAGTPAGADRGPEAPRAAKARVPDEMNQAGHAGPDGGRTAAPGQGHVTWDEAQRIAARVVAPAAAVTVPLERAARQVLAAPVEALADLPSFDTAAMDGWAVAGPGPWAPADRQDGPGVLAGHDAPELLADGCAVRIATGARMPDGATAVLRSEHAELRGGRLCLAAGAPAHGGGHGTDVRPRGQECRTGDRLLPAGTPVTPPVLGLAAAAGYDRLTVTPRPRAEVLVLGDELLHSGLPSGGRIRDALGPMVGPWLAALGAEVLVTRRLGDDAEALHEAVTTTTADLLVTTGGTAHGPEDHVRPTLHRVGARLLVDGVEVRPGHPMLLAALAGEQEGRHLVGLPGNPLAAVSGLLTLAAPLLRARAGLPEPEPVRASLTAEVQGHPRDTRLVPVTRSADGSGATPLRWTGPAMLRGIAGASALAAVPPGGAAAGTSVRLLELPW